MTVTVNRSSALVWGVLLAVGALWEVRGLVWTGQGATLSALVWSGMLAWPGLLVMVLCVWLPWHFGFAARRGLGWPDALCVLVGVVLWLVARNNQGRP